MKRNDLTLEVLKEIRDELRGTKAEVRQTNERLDHLESSLGGRLDRLERRQSESEIRLATELVAVVGAVNQVRDLLAARLDFQDKVNDHERRLRALEERSGA